MKHEFLVPVLVAAVLCAACASPGNTLTRLDLLGDPAPVSAATRAVTIAPNTEYVSVEANETVKFTVGEKSFAWTFDGVPEGYVFNLQRVAPPGLLAHKIEAYVGANPLIVGQ